MQVPLSFSESLFVNDKNVLKCSLCLKVLKCSYNMQFERNETIRVSEAASKTIFGIVGTTVACMV